MLIGAIYFIPRYGFEHWKVAYSAFRPTFLLTLFMFFYAINTKAWVNYGVNHVLIFEYDPRNRLSVFQVFEVASIGLFIWSLAGVLYIVSPVLGIHQFIVPGILLLSFLALFSIPLPILFFRSRLWLIKKLIRIPLAPLFRVDFADFWLADQLNSLVTVLLDVEFYLCSVVVFLIGLTGNQLDGCGTHVYGVRPVIACMPAWFRFMQCLRRYRDTGRAFPHLVNAGKYSSSLFVVFFSTLSATVKDSSGQDTTGYLLTVVLWVAAGVVNTLYTTAWDLFMDWGLFEGRCSLRKERIYPYKILYILAAIEDGLLRCAWTLTLSVGQTNLFPQEIIAFPIAALEVFRRFVWNFFRLENEHLNNCGEFRVVRDISLKPLELR
ncbi:Xenotropic and polytropic retrovirus receptor 1-like [Oopsacas minuta]|uniref:Xenotropic and polytropic retrovirus receptor 1-like n=1 Tax=Oopsacas minuta TaxID=111878 RepID=A0AAV7JT94_9METZ|nr:Xenotropic and polytropic retrovirus receptor 1-like [Oopsacas minuta]